jgi:hypothetical protein
MEREFYFGGVKGDSPSSQKHCPHGAKSAIGTSRQILIIRDFGHAQVLRSIGCRFRSRQNERVATNRDGAKGQVNPSLSPS